MWSDSKARISWLLQNATPQANIAILQPLNDLWLKIGPQRDPFPQKWYPDYQNNLWEVIHQNGGGCDYVSESIINRAACKNGKMIYNKRSWHTLLLPEIETLALETAQSLTDFVESGGRVVFIEKTPSKSPSFFEPESNDSQVKKTIENLLKRAKNRAILYPAPKGDPIKWFEKLQVELRIKPYVKFSKPQKYLSQSCYELGGNKLFLIANTSLSENISVKAEFQVGNNLHPWIWDAETGKRWVYPANDTSNIIEFTLPRATSILIVFDKDSSGERYLPPKLNTGGHEITGEWQLQLNHINGSRQQLELKSLTDLSRLEKTKDFAGTAIYQKTININNKESRSIDLGHVLGISELSLNGKRLGTRWYGAQVYDISGALKEGENELSVRLTTITGNYLKGLKDSPLAQRWTRNQPVKSMGILGPVKIIP